jgi:hypothetical protein
MSIGIMIAESAKLSLGYSEKLLAGVTADKFARFAPGENGVIESNHPAFIYGHLSLYSPRVVEGLGGDVSNLKPSDKFVEVFDQGVTCVDDPDGSIYPAMDEITERLITTQKAAIEALSNAPDSALTAPNENAMKERFSTVGSMMAFYLGGHFMIHMGQMSAWRRMMGLGSA